MATTAMSTFMPVSQLPITTEGLPMVSPTSPTVPSSSVEISEFESKAWQDAVHNFRKDSRHDVERLNRFLVIYASPHLVDKACRDKQRELTGVYSNALGKILNKVNIFINAGNLVVKGAPESIGLAWTAVQLTLNALQDDFQTFQIFSKACTDIISIILTCRLFTRMFSESQGPIEFQEIQDKVIKEVPTVYEQILEFSYQMWKTSEEGKLFRIAKSILRKNKDKFDGMLQALNDGEETLSEYATKATQALSLYYHKKVAGSQTKILADLDKIQASLKSSAAGNRELQAIIKELETLKNRTPMDVAKATFAEQEKQLNMALNLDDAWDRRAKNRSEGTCEWISNRPEFMEWRDSPNSSLLWVFGHGNSGKSVLVSSVIGGLLAASKDDPSMIVHYFFCRNGEDHAQLTVRILDQILCSLYRNAPSDLDRLNRCNEIVKKYLSKESPAKVGAGDVSERKKGNTTFEEAYAEVAKIMGKRKYIIVIDALDECVDREKADFIVKMKNLVANTEVTIKLFISSRPEEDIRGGFNETAQINIEKYNDDDIKRVIKKRLDELPGLSPLEIEEAHKGITKRAGNSFGYIDPAIETLRKPWQRPLSRHLDSLPNDILNMNAQIFRRIDPAYVGFLETCLTWTILANGNQKVLVDEVVDAFSGIYLDGTCNWVEKELNTEQLQFYKHQISLYGSAFMEVDIETREISLIKPAIVKDSFLQVKSDELQKPSEPNVCIKCAAKQESTSKFVLTERDGHLKIALTIFKHLNSPTFCQRFLSDTCKDDDLDDSREGLSDGGEESHENTKSLPTSTDQASTNENSNTEDFQGVIETMLRERVEPEVNSATKLTVGNAAGGDGATVASDKNSSADGNVVQTAGNEVQVNERSEAPPTLRRFDTFVNNIEDDDISSNADSDYQDETAIEAAYFEEQDAFNFRYELRQCIYHLQQVEKLWEDVEEKPAAWDELWKEVGKFFTTNSRSFKAWAKTSFDGFKEPSITPLHVMAQAGLIEGTRRFLNRGDLVDAPTELGLVPLHYSAILEDNKTQIEVSRLLLEAGANPNYSMPDGNVDTAFIWMLCGHPTAEAVQLFLKYDANVDVKGRDSWSILQNFAAFGTDPAIIDILIEAGADINAKDAIGETALHILVARSDVSKEMVEAFVAAGADVNAEDKESQKPMYECSKDGKLDIIEVLLKHDAEVDDLDTRGWSALSQAAYYGRPEIARLLVRNGANFTRSDNFGRTLFYLACQSGDMETIRYFADLLKTKDKADVYNLPANSGKTPFRKACAKASIELPKFLLEELGVPIDIDATDNLFGRTALHVAAYRGLEDIVDLLIKHGAKSELVDKHGKTPLQLAYENWPLPQINNTKSEKYENIVSRLIDLDRKTAVQEIELLHIAAARGSMLALKKLILQQPSVDPNLRDDHGWNAIDHARQWRRKDAEDFLLQQGIIGKRPSAWVSTDPQRVVVSEDGLSIWQANEAGEMQKMDSRHTVFSNHPIPSRIEKYYFEITISKQDEKPEKLDHRREIAFGVSQRTQNEKRRQSWIPGLQRNVGRKFNSWGWHGDDGACVKTLGYPRYFIIDTYGPGDTVGCAVDFTKGTIFYTKNGKRLMEKAWSDLGGKLYCCIGISDRIKATANFEGPFVWEKGDRVDFEYHQEGSK